MKAVVYEDTRLVGIREVADAGIQDPGDVVIRVTSSAICGTDLHMYGGRTGADPGLVLGHEPVGTVEEVGSSVTLLARGERVVVPTHLFCGLCFNCVRGYTAAYRYAGMGPYRGAQAELLRVPYADANCVSLPGEPFDDREDDFVLLADAFVTGWHATEMAEVTPATSVPAPRSRALSGCWPPTAPCCAAPARSTWSTTCPSGSTRPVSWAPRRSTSRRGTRSSGSASCATPGWRTSRRGARASWTA